MKVDYNVVIFYILIQNMPHVSVKKKRNSKMRWKTFISNCTLLSHDNYTCKICDILGSWIWLKFLFKENNSTCKTISFWVICALYAALQKLYNIMINSFVFYVLHSFLNFSLISRHHQLLGVINLDLLAWHQGPYHANACCHIGPQF